VAVLCKCVRPQLRCVRPQNCTASLSEGPGLARRRVMSSHASANVLGLAAVRSTASTAFDRTVCSLNFPEPEQNAKNNIKKKNKLRCKIKYEQNLQCRKIKTSRKIHQSKNYVNFQTKTTVPRQRRQNLIVPKIILANCTSRL
jgi:hypothetical protein